MCGCVCVCGGGVVGGVRNGMWVCVLGGEGGGGLCMYCGERGGGGGERGRGETMHVETGEERKKVLLLTKVPQFEQNIRLMQEQKKLLKLKLR